MSTPFKPATRLIRAIAAAIALTCLVTSVQAASMPNSTRKVALTAREQPIDAFLQNLFAAVDVPVNIAPGLTGTINGTFRGRARKVLRDVSRAYNMVGYYDGAVMHIVPASSLVRRTYAVTPAQADRMQRVVAELDMTDARNSLRRASDGSMQAFGTPRFVQQLDDLFRANQARNEIPKPSAAADFRVFYLRYAWAQDVSMTIGGRQVVVPGVASILRSVVGIAGNQASPAGERLINPTVPGLRGQGLASQGEKIGADGQPIKAKSNSVDLLVNALAHSARPAQQAQPIQPQQEQVQIQADPRLNAVIVRDRADRLARYEQLIAALDVEPLSVEIEATIIDVNTDRMRELGVDWRVQRSGKSLAFNGGLPTTGAGAVASMVVGSATQFFARIRALQGEGAARIVSSPQVVTLSNVEAVFDNSSNFFVRVAGREQVDLFNVKAGTSLRVTPNVFQDRNETRIKLLVQVEDGNVTGQQVDQIPVVERSSINTQALIMEGQSLLIGGMVRDSATSGVNKVPVLGDVPIVGGLFRSKSKTNSRIERMFLITPRVANTRRAAEPPAGQPTGVRYASQAQPAAAPRHAPQAAPAPRYGQNPQAAGSPRYAQAPRPAVVRPSAGQRASGNRSRRSSRVLDLNALMQANKAQATPAPRLLVRRVSN